jgi:putative (di)nucleoside polyphosphate hydrolase
MGQVANKNNIDRDGYRKNVGIIVCNNRCQVLWARRVRHDGWQFPQGGIEPEESARDAAFRELYEEIGLESSDVHLLGATDNWLRYDVPYAAKSHYYRRTRQFRGQKQRWFLFKLVSQESSVRLDISDTPEFDQWQWVDYWRPLQQIVEFKKSVYRKALTELEPLLQQLEYRLKKD